MSDILHAQFYVPEPKFVTSLLQGKADIIHVPNVHMLRQFIAALCKCRRQKSLLRPYYHRTHATSRFHDRYVMEN